MKEQSQQNAGTKHDDGKSPLTLVPYEFLERVGLALDFGAKKYELYNFTKGLGMMRLLAAASRHIWKYCWKSKVDEESGLSHLAHAGACIAMAVWHEENRPDLDDTYRNKVIENSKPQPSVTQLPISDDDDMPDDFLEHLQQYAEEQMPTTNQWKYNPGPMCGGSNYTHKKDEK